MKLNIISIALCCLFLPFSYGQIDSDKNIKPILVDKTVLSGVGLQKIDLKNEPEKDFYQRKLFGGKDISVYVVSTESWVNKLNNYPFDEYVYLFHGESKVTPENESSKTFYTTDHIFMPKGFNGEWEIRAGSNLHYELSVISSARADSSKLSKHLSYIDFNNTTLSGCQISFEEGQYEEIIHEGVELKISLKAEIPNERMIEKQDKDQLIHIQSGQLSFIDQDKAEQVFYTGDFVVLPKGLEGLWKSEGHGMMKYLVVEKADD